MASLWCEFRVVFPIDGFTGVDRSAVRSGLVCRQCPYMVARRHAGSGPGRLERYVALITRVHHQGCLVPGRLFVFPLLNPVPVPSHPPEPC